MVAIGPTRNTRMSANYVGSWHYSRPNLLGGSISAPGPQPGITRSGLMLAESSMVSPR
jgi:hypothetical protein